MNPKTSRPFCHRLPLYLAHAAPCNSLPQDIGCSLSAYYHRYSVHLFPYEEATCFANQKAIAVYILLVTLDQSIILEKMSCSGPNPLESVTSFLFNSLPKTDQSSDVTCRNPSKRRLLATLCKIQALQFSSIIAAMRTERRHSA